MPPNNKLQYTIHHCCVKNNSHWLRRLMNACGVRPITGGKLSVFHYQWLKYKLGGPGTLKQIWGPTVS